MYKALEQLITYHEKERQLLKSDIEDLKKGIDALLRIADSGHQLEEIRLMKIHEVEEMISFTRKWIYARMAKGQFPKPVKIGNASRWRHSEVKQWIADLSKERPD